MSTDTIDAIADRLTALGYTVTAGKGSLAIDDTMVWWVWPNGENVCEHRPTVLVDHSDDPDHKFCRWELQFFRHSKSAWLTEVERHGADPGDAALAHLQPPGNFVEVIRRTPADLWVSERVTQARPDPDLRDWWTAWHAASARPKLIAAAIRNRRVDRWWPLVRSGELLP
ncbi:hypothetical protein [Mycolicibacterium fortuitum]|uniref:hypothetical protein n=1 Tax=Mycolicibacterium fortuitum TaxID=1766 RepID=UPI001CE10399|nr:hypothetical protein [Mycolicibacterium fortuitum]MCA4727416.1 hypothetical protein [Mycolicibacterium fortuitum]